MKKIISVMLAVLLAVSTLMLVSCSSEEAGEATTISKSAVNVTMNGNSAECDASGVYVSDGKISITLAGTYVFTGSFNGQIYVDCIDAGRLELVLNGASITNDTNAAVYIRKAQEAVLTLFDGSVNTLADGANYVFDNPDDDEPNAVLFSKEDLVIRGGGSLSVDANYANGIVSKDGLIIENGVIDVDSVGHGIKGKDFLNIKGGTVTVKAFGDGLKSTNYADETVGYVEINGGDVDIYSEDEAVQAVSAVTVNAGTLKIKSINNGIKCAGAISLNGGIVDLTAEDNAVDGSAINVSEVCSVTINGTPYKG